MMKMRSAIVVLISVLSGGNCVSGSEGRGSESLLRNPSFEEGFQHGIPLGWKLVGTGKIRVGSKNDLCVQRWDEHTAEYVVHFHPGKYDGALVQVAETTPGVRYRLSAEMNAKFAAKIEQLCKTRKFTEREGWDFWAELGYDLSGQTRYATAETITYTNLYNDADFEFSKWTRLVSTFVATGPKTSIFLRSGQKWGGAIAMVWWNEVELEALIPLESTAATGSGPDREPMPVIRVEETYAVGEGYGLPGEDLLAIFEEGNDDVPEECENSIVISNPFGKMDVLAVVPVRCREGGWWRIEGEARLADVYPRGANATPGAQLEVEYALLPEEECLDKWILWRPFPLSEEEWQPFSFDFVPSKAESCLAIRTRSDYPLRDGILLRNLDCVPVLEEAPQFREEEVMPPRVSESWQAGSWKLDHDWKMIPAPEAVCGDIDWPAAPGGDAGEPYFEQVKGREPFDTTATMFVSTKPGARYRVSFPYVLIRTTGGGFGDIHEPALVDDAFSASLGIDISGHPDEDESRHVRYHSLSEGRRTCTLYDFSQEFVAKSLRTTFFLRTRQEHNGISGIRVGSVKLERLSPGDSMVSVSKDLAELAAKARAAGDVPLRWRRLLDSAGEGESPKVSGPDVVSEDGIVFRVLGSGSYRLIVPHPPIRKVGRLERPDGISVPEGTSGNALEIASTEVGPCLRLCAFQSHFIQDQYFGRVKVDLSSLPSGETTVSLPVRCLDGFSSLATRLTAECGDVKSEFLVSPDGEWKVWDIALSSVEGEQPELVLTLSAPDFKPCVVDFPLPFRFATSSTDGEVITDIGVLNGERGPLDLKIASDGAQLSDLRYDELLSSTVAEVSLPEGGDLAIQIPQHPGWDRVGALLLPGPFSEELSAEFRETFQLVGVRGPFGIEVRPVPATLVAGQGGAYSAAGIGLLDFLLQAYLHGENWAEEFVAGVSEDTGGFRPSSPQDWLVPLLLSKETAPLRLHLLGLALEDGRLTRKDRLACEWHIVRARSEGLSMGDEGVQSVMETLPRGNYMRDSLLIRKADFLVGLGREEEAMELLEQVQHPALKEQKVLSMGLAYLGAGDLGSAAEMLESLDTDSMSHRQAEQALMGLACVYIAEGQLAPAEEVLQRYILQARDDSEIQAAKDLLNQITF